MVIPPPSPIKTMSSKPLNWFITGTSSGFGLAMTTMLLARGDTVFATLRKPQRLEDLRRDYPETLHTAMLDVTNTADVRRVVDDAFRLLGRLDVIVNNAGYGLFGAAEELTDEQIRRQIDTNLIGSIQVIRAVLPHLRAQGSGRVLQVSSEGGQTAYPAFSLYHASKWGIEGFIESVSQEVAGFGIEFTIAEPGAALTNFGAGLDHPEPMVVYEASRVGEIRRAVMSRSLEGFGAIGDPEKMVRAMIDSVDIRPAPKRLALGSGAYAHIRDALSGRMAQLEVHKTVTMSTDISVDQAH